MVYICKKSKPHGITMCSAAVFIIKIFLNLMHIGPCIIVTVEE